MASSNPWKRGRPESWGSYEIPRHSFWERFDRFIDANIDLDVDTKSAALKASGFVVSIVSLVGGKVLFMGSGTIIDCEVINGTYFSTILTSACLLRSSPESDGVPVDIQFDVYLSDGTSFEGAHIFAYDFHYNLATIKIESDAALPTASLRYLDDSIAIYPSEIEDKGVGSKSWQLRPRSDLFSLSPGDTVIAMGRYFDKPNDLMAAPGKFSLDCCKFDCKELFRANCKISKCGVGGPLINRYGEVIGVNFYDQLCTPFLPINIVSKCLEHFKKYGRFYRPLLGMKMANLYAASLGKLERIMLKFPNISKGLLVEEVVVGSPAECAGIHSGDVIVQCTDNFVQSFLEFYEIIWDKAGESVEVVVIREASGDRLHLTMKVDDTTPDKFYRWPLPKKCRVFVKRLRL